MLAIDGSFSQVVVKLVEIVAFGVTFGPPRGGEGGGGLVKNVGNLCKFVEKKADFSTIFVQLC